MPHLEKSKFRPPVPFPKKGLRGDDISQREDGLVDIVL
jgi:hypothetical protein